PLRLGLHSGAILAQEGQLPQGAVPMIAFELVQQATEGSVQLSENSQRLLAPFFDTEPEGVLSSLQAAQELTTHTLTAERESETGTALRPWSADRPMVGRDEEKTEALTAWGKAQTEGQALILHGQAGIGKSKLTHEVKQAVRAQGALVRECRCLPEHQNNALFPFLTMLQHHWGIASTRTDEEAQEKLAVGLKAAGEEVSTLLPLFASWLNIKFQEQHYTQLTQTPEEQKALLFGALQRILSTLDANNPFLLVLEDLHWLDPTSTEFVTQLLAQLKGHRLLLLMTTRPNFTNPWAGDLYEQINLETLPEEAVGFLVRATLSADSVEDQAIAYILDRTDGIPLFVEEMTSMLKESKYLIEEREVYKLVDNIEDQSVPSTLADLLNARLDRMASAKETAQLAAAIGREFDYELLLKASQKNEDKVLADLDQLTKADLVYRQKSGQGANYIFRHALIRDAAYDGMVTAHRQSIHENLGKTIETHFPEMLENTPMEPARHYAGANNHEKAVQLGTSALDKQINISGNLEAIGITNQVRNWIECIPDEVVSTEKKLIVNTKVMPAVMTINGYGDNSLEKLVEENEQYMKQLKKQKGFEESELEDHSLKTQWTKFQKEHWTSNGAEAEKIGTESLAQAIQAYQEASEKKEYQRAERLKVFMMALRNMLGQRVWFNGSPEGAIQLHEGAYRLYDDGKDVEPMRAYGVDGKVQYYVMASVPYMTMGMPHKAMRMVNDALAYAKKIDHAPSTTFAYIHWILVYYKMGDLEAVINKSEEYFQLWVGKPGEPFATNFIKMLYYSAIGQPEESTRIIDMMVDSGQPSAISWYMHYACCSYMELGKTALESSNLLAQKHFKTAYDLIKKYLDKVVEIKEYAGFPFIFLTMARTIHFYPDGEDNPVESISYFLNQAISYASEHKTRLYQLEALNFYLWRVLEYPEQYTNQEVAEVIDRMEQLIHEMKEHPEVETDIPYPQWEKAMALIKRAYYKAA
ncbi:MAG TPA: hypothetical protein DCR93_15045, partial [Cytophagales bacterium]|nr:hypothetical protein [Cytophagales bacterium]